MADGVQPFPLTSVRGLDQALMRSSRKGDPDVIVKLFSLARPRTFSGPAENMSDIDRNRDAPFYSGVLPDGLAATPNSTEARAKHLAAKDQVAAGDLVFADATPVSIRVLFLLSRGGYSTTGV